MAKRIYYAVYGKEAQDLCQQVFAMVSEYNAAIQNLRNAYDAEVVVMGWAATGLAFPTNEKRQGLRVGSNADADGFFYAYPDARTTIGRKLKKELELARIPHTHPSELITNHYKAYRSVENSSGHTATGVSLSVTVSHPSPCGQFLTLSIPVDPKAPFSPPEGAKEITKEEYEELVSSSKEA